MKIMSLNVNNFGGMHHEKPRWEAYRPLGREYREAMNIFQQDPCRVETAETIVKAVETKAPDAMVFQEFDINAPAGQRAVKSLKKCGYQPIYPDKELEIRKNYSITMMFAKEQLQAVPCASPQIIIGGEPKWAWRWCVMKISDLKIIGVHAPLNGNAQKFFDAMQECAREDKEDKMIMLGDMNVHSKEPCMYFNTFDLIRSNSEGGLRYFDAVEDGQITYFPAGTTIDHVLISPILRDNVNAIKIFEQQELELSDHAVIIVDVDL